MSKILSLSEKLSSLIHTKPVLSGSDEDDDLTRPEQLTKDDNQSDNSADESELVKFGKLNIEFLDADDNKYSGKKSSRVEHANAFGSDSSDVEETSDENQDDFAVSDNESDVENKDVECEDNSFLEKKMDLASPNDDKFNEDIISKASTDIEKGNAIKNQLHIWDFLLECRMKFQTSLTAANQFPKYDQFKSFLEQGGADFQNLLSQNEKSLKHLLTSLMNFQEVLLIRNDDFKESNFKHKLPISDEEITSESDVEKDNAKYSASTLESRSKRRKLSDFSMEINERHKSMEEFRNKTIQKWNDKTRLGHISNKDFHGFEQSTLKQIEHVLQDKQRLIEKTQVKRSSYHILGQSDEEVTLASKLLETSENENQIRNKSERRLCEEIFDDDDFYVQLLNELVKRKGNDITDPLQLSKQWVQLQKARSKVKKDIDRRASKGRKIRYIVHPKLVNFMMPISKSFCTEESRTELINSIFGKNKK